MNFGEKFREARQARNMSQIELADKIGCHRNTISLWEHGSVAPVDIPLVAAAERALEQPPGSFLIPLGYPASAQVRHRPARVVTVAQGHEASTVSV